MDRSPSNPRATKHPGLWPATEGVQTQIPADRRVDGIAEVTFQSVLSPVRGRKQTRLAFKDEANVFRRPCRAARHAALDLVQLARERRDSMSRSPHT